MFIAICGTVKVPVGVFQNTCKEIAKSDADFVIFQPSLPKYRLHVHLYLFQLQLSAEMNMNLALTGVQLACARSIIKIKQNKCKRSCGICKNEPVEQGNKRNQVNEL